MAGDDTTPDPLFKNVLRRSLKEEPEGGDPGGSSVSNASVSPPATSTASNKRRPSSIGKLMGGGGATEDNKGGGESPSVVGASSKVKKKKKEEANTDGFFFPNKAHVTDTLRDILANLDASNPTLVFEKHMPPSDRNKGQNRLLMSCKCESKRASFASIFTETEMPLVHEPAEPLKTEDEEHDNNDHHGGGKDGKGKKKDAGENSNNNKTKGGSEEDGGMVQHKNKWQADDGCSSVGKDEDTGADKKENQQHGSKQGSTVAPGLAVQAYDRDGRAYKLNLKYLSSNTSYRIIGHDYTVFLDNNGLLVDGGGMARKRSAGRRQKRRRRSSLPDEEPNDDEQPAAVPDAADDIQMELWAFRSPKLTIGEKDQPDGALGLLLLHCRGGELGEVTGQARVGGGAAAAKEVQVAAPQDQDEVVVVVEQPQQNIHGMATQGEDMAAAGDCVGGEDAATVVDDAAGKVGDAAPRSTRDMPLCPVERVTAVWLSFHSANDNGEADANDDCTCKQGPPS